VPLNLHRPRLARDQPVRVGVIVAVVLIAGIHHHDLGLQQFRAASCAAGSNNRWNHRASDNGKVTAHEHVGGGGAAIPLPAPPPPRHLRTWATLCRVGRAVPPVARPGPRTQREPVNPDRSRLGAGLADVEHHVVSDRHGDLQQCPHGVGGYIAAVKNTTRKGTAVRENREIDLRVTPKRRLRQEPGGGFECRAPPLPGAGSRPSGPSGPSCSRSFTADASKPASRSDSADASRLPASGGRSPVGVRYAATQPRRRSAAPVTGRGGAPSGRFAVR
jgi:hypothetical protein